MWSLLQRIIGKSSRSQEKWMDDLKPQVNISVDQLSMAVELLQPLVETSYKLQLKQSPQAANEVLNDKGKPIPYYGSIDHPDYELNLYLDQETFRKKPSNLKLVLVEKEFTGSNKEPLPSLPIWEQLIHLDVRRHKKLVKILPDHPWTLYKKAKNQLIQNKSRNLVKGYPQWLINDIDFRKVADSEFLFQLEIVEHRTVLYFFKYKSGLETHFFIQKD